jgi:HD superfamily phosphodiesterase
MFSFAFHDLSHCSSRISEREDITSAELLKAFMEDQNRQLEIDKQQCIIAQNTQLPGKYQVLRPQSFCAYTIFLHKVPRLI